MATLEQPKILVTEPAVPPPSSPVPTDDEILRWVAKVDNCVVGDSVDILKLSTRSELTQNERDGVERASDLYHALANHYTDSKVLLARFIYALEKLGHRRYGHRAVRLLPYSDSLPRFDRSKLKPTVVENYFILLQQLAVLCCMLPSDYNIRFIAHFAKKMDPEGSINPKQYHTPCDVLTASLMECSINTDNQFNEIEEALIKVDLPESQILEYFDNYEKIAVFERLRSPCSISDKTSSESSPDQLQGKKNPIKKIQYSSDRSALSDTSSPSPVPISSDYNSSTSSTHREITSRRRPTERAPTECTPLLKGGGQDQTKDAGALPNVRPAITNLNKKKKHCKILCGCAIFLILLILAVGAAVCIGFAVKQYRANQSTTEQYHENSSVVLTERSHFYTESLTVIEDTEHLNDYRHDIDVYHAEGKCSNLANAITYTINGSDFSSIPTVYALAGSFISVHICGSTNAIIDSERLEIVLSNHLEESNFDQTPYKVNFFHPGLNGKQKCKNVTFDLSANGFYTLSLVHPSIPISFDFNLTYKVLAVDHNLLAEHAIANYTLRADQESYKFIMSPGVRHSCFVAVIRGNPHTSKGDVHIQLKYGNRMDGLIAGAIVLCATVVLALVILVFLAALAIKHTKTE